METRTIGEPTIDTIDGMTVFFQEHVRQERRRLGRLKQLDGKPDYSVTLRRRLYATWTAEIVQDLKTVHGLTP